ncbi:glyoxalase [Microtetraspora sp. NBRC 13810]|uniref:VOC family protein n=1 Tax=Microtetraspora sp. NBRC 13810 TaxID=3030990 RepID=UPI0024A21079|nr:VOC family protein [Microtetraspora sp. NBRC 13810]GLW07933.1 glyoxalase [Microtetraspora sp. NBRC 13810]
MTAIARMRSTVLDCPDPMTLAGFYSKLLGWPITEADDEWAVVGAGGPNLAFQRVEGHRPPIWPGAEHPQQLHIDLDVDDLDKAEAEVLALGAVKHDYQPGNDFRVFLDPAGHPFCLCV